MSGRSVRFAWAVAMGSLLAIAPRVHAAELPEYRLKAAFVYNFALFTEWPHESGDRLFVCVLGQDPFGREIDALDGKVVGRRLIAIRRQGIEQPVDECDIVFVPRSSIDHLPRLLTRLQGSPVLTVADSPGAAAKGVALNMVVNDGRVTFEANLKTVRAANLRVSSKLLRLATKVFQ